MSVPFHILECASCRYRATTFVLDGIFLWTDGDDVYRFQPRLGVCHSCKKVVAMERLPSPVDLIREQERVDALKLEHEKQKGFLRRLFKKEHRNGPLSLNEGFAVAQKVIALHRPPVCLSCGSAHVEPIEWSNLMSTDDENARSLSVAHPGCSGTFVLFGSGGLQEQRSLQTFTFDLDGRLLSKRYGR